LKKIKYFVFDTNVLVSGMLFPGSKPALSLKKAFDNGTLVTSEECMSEPARMITDRRFDKYISFTNRQLFLLYFSERVLFTDITCKISECRDPLDNKFLELAISAQETCIITGDADLLSLHPFRGIPIMTPAKFLSDFK
jgi:putative PIN family toxin of toxin-antitoxin system